MPVEDAQLQHHTESKSVDRSTDFTATTEYKTSSGTLGCVNLSESRQAPLRRRLATLGGLSPRRGLVLSGPLIKYRAGGRFIHQPMLSPRDIRLFPTVNYSVNFMRLHQSSVPSLRISITTSLTSNQSTLALARYKSIFALALLTKSLTL